MSGNIVYEKPSNDIYNFNGPILNRCRLFMHKLQCKKDLEWDDILPEEIVKEWILIVKQVNAAPPIKIKRCVGCRTEEYNLVAFTDSSRCMERLFICKKSKQAN